MAGVLSITGKTALEYVRNYNGKMSKKKLAELMYHKHPDIFNSAEHARLMIRAITKSSGKNDRIKEHTVEWKPLELPEPENNDYSKYIVKGKRIGILSDIHIPYFDKAALNAALLYLHNWKPDTIILNGDTLDMYHASNFEKDPRQRSIKYELDLFKQFVTQLIDRFPNTKIIFKYGNHEERYEKKILQRLPEFIDLEWTRLDYVLEANKYGIEIVTDKRLMKAGHLNIAHGQEFSKGFIMPVNIARGFFLKAKANILVGHHHRTSEHIEQDINGKLIGAWSTGCLSELHPKYMSLNNWNHGFATVEIDGDDFKVDNIKIIKGKIL